MVIPQSKRFYIRFWGRCGEWRRMGRWRGGEAGEKIKGETEPSVYVHNCARNTFSPHSLPPFSLHSTPLSIPPPLLSLPLSLPVQTLPILSPSRCLCRNAHPHPPYPSLPSPRVPSPPLPCPRNVRCSFTLVRVFVFLCRHFFWGVSLSAISLPTTLSHSAVPLLSRPSLPAPQCL